MTCKFHVCWWWKYVLLSWIVCWNIFNRLFLMKVIIQHKNIWCRQSFTKNGVHVICTLTSWKQYSIPSRSLVFYVVMGTHMGHWWCWISAFIRDTLCQNYFYIMHPFPFVLAKHHGDSLQKSPLSILVAITVLKC